MIEYRMIDESCLLPYCLHSGAVPLASLSHPEEARARFEAEHGLPHSPVAEFLQALSRNYGAVGVIAVDGDVIVGKVRFAPRYLFGGTDQGCVQSEDGVKAIKAVELEKLTPFEDLRPKSLFIWCFQALPAYAGQGIGTSMLRTLIAWARENGWEEMHASAIGHIRPLLDWTGAFSIDRYRNLGFVETGHRVHEDLKAGVVAMRGGHHGEDLKKQWEQYAHLSDDEASEFYDVLLDIRQAGRRP